MENRNRNRKECLVWFPVYFWRFEGPEVTLHPGNMEIGVILYDEILCLFAIKGFISKEKDFTSFWISQSQCNEDSTEV